MDYRLMIVDFGCLIYSSSCRVSRQAVQVASRRFAPQLPCSIDFQSSASLMKGVNDEHTVKSKLSFRRKLLYGISAFFLVVIGLLFWQLYTYNNAVRMAKEAGFYWSCDDPISLIRRNWRYAFENSTWGPHDRVLVIKKVSTLDDYRQMLQYLRPTALDISGCPELKNVNALKGLTDLEILTLRACTALQNVDSLKSISSLEDLDLSGCHKIPAADLRELSAALPKTNIVFPDNTNNPPQE